MERDERIELEQWFRAFDFVALGAISLRDVSKILELMIIVIKPPNLVKIAQSTREDGLFPFEDVVTIYHEAKRQDKRVESHSLANSLLMLNKRGDCQVTRSDFQNLNRVINHYEFTEPELAQLFSEPTEQVHRLVARMNYCP